MSADPRAITDCAVFLCSGDEILLLDAGTHLLGNSLLDSVQREKPVTGVRVSALASDVRSRGLEQRAIDSGIELINQAQWVERVCASQRILSFK